MRGLIRALGVVLSIVIGGVTLVLAAAPANACPTGATGVSAHGGATVCVAVVSKKQTTTKQTTHTSTTHREVQPTGGNAAVATPPATVVGIGATVCPGVYTAGLCPTRPAPPAGPVPVVSSKVLATRALGQLQLMAPAVHLAPAPPLKTYTGLETWLWMPQGQWAPRRLSVTAGPTAVTVTATPTRTYWDMGDGERTCYGPGRAWVRSYSEYEKTDCSYTYEHVSSYEPGGKFPVEATIVYQVDWTCRGTCTQRGGTLGEVDGLTGRSAIRVSERQSVVTG